VFLNGKIEREFWSKIFSFSFSFFFEFLNFFSPLDCLAH